MARLVKAMLGTKVPKLMLDRTTILGFSLGAHVAGYAGAAIPGLRKIIGENSRLRTRSLFMDVFWVQEWIQRALCMLTAA